MTEAESPVLPILAAYKAAVYAKDVDAFLAIYDQDISIFDMWAEWEYRGIVAWRKIVEGWFGSLQEERVLVDFSNIQTTSDADMAMAYLFVSYQAIAQDGTRLRGMQNRMTLALRRRQGVWQIVHQHTSSPIEFETTKAIFLP